MTGTPVDPLRVTELTMRFGGLVALNAVALTVPEARIVGLIGPNGAGKTTLFDCVTGVHTPSAGRVELFGEDVTDWPPHERARLGIARTYQRLELFGNLSVLDNLVVAAEAKAGRGGVVADLFALPASLEGRDAATERARAMLELTGMTAYAGTPAGDLPLGLARVVEFARALCADPRLLLLDEPSSGLREDESRRLADLIRAARDGDGVSVLLVEHDMAFVLGLCDEVYVLDFGRMLAHGTPAEIRADPAVRAAYLGEEVGADARTPARR